MATLAWFSTGLLFLAILLVPYTAPSLIGLCLLAIAWTAAGVCEWALARQCHSADAHPRPDDSS